MKINSIVIQDFSASYYGKNINNNKKHSTPSFQADYDYDNKPVPPAGKVVAAVSALALIAAMLHTVKYNNQKPEDNKELDHTVIFEEQEFYDDYDDDDKIAADTRSEYSKQKEKFSTIKDETATDSVSSDSLHINDTTAKEPVISNFHGSSYKVLTNGDTVVLVPLPNVQNSGDLKRDSLY